MENLIVLKAEPSPEWLLWQVLRLNRSVFQCPRHSLHGRVRDVVTNPVIPVPTKLIPAPNHLDETFLAPCECGRRTIVVRRLEVSWGDRKRTIFSTVVFAGQCPACLAVDYAIGETFTVRRLPKRRPRSIHRPRGLGVSVE